MKTRLLILAAAGLLTACSSNGDDESGSGGGGGVLCPLWIAPGVMIEVRDASTGQPAGCDTKGSAESAGEVQSLDNGTPCSLDPAAQYVSGISHTGTWRVTLEKDGYKTWSVDGVQVKSGVCGLQTVQLRADLEPI